MVRPIAAHFRQAGPDAGFERELDKFQTESDEYPRLRPQLAGLRFYLQEILWETGTAWSAKANGVTNYVRLLHVLDRWRHKRNEHVCIINFNYDLLLDDAFATLDRSLRSLKEYISDPDYTYIKPHGSVNWIRSVRIPLSSSSGRGMVLQLVQNIHRAEATNTFAKIESREQIARSPALPALMIPLEEKASFELPRAHADALRERLAKTDRMLVVGWRATERHFLELVSEVATSVRAGLIVRGGRAGAEQTARVLKSAGLPGFSVSERGFSHMFGSAELQSLLDL